MQAPSTFATACLATLLTACTWMPGPLRTGGVAVAAEQATTIHRHAAKALPTEADEEEPASGHAVPTPKEIFDFRPPGSKADSWRSPFVIDTDDGPLRAEIRRSNEQMRKFREDRAKEAAKPSAPGATVATKSGAAKCGEQDVANAKPGCPHPPAMHKGTGATTLDPLATGR